MVQHGRDLFFSGTVTTRKSFFRLGMCHTLLLCKVHRCVYMIGTAEYILLFLRYEDCWVIVNTLPSFLALSPDN
jgi:hypothetical protein